MCRATADCPAAQPAARARRGQVRPPRTRARPMALGAVARQVGRRTAAGRPVRRGRGCSTAPVDMLLVDGFAKPRSLARRPTHVLATVRPSAINFGAGSWRDRSAGVSSIMRQLRSRAACLAPLPADQHARRSYRSVHFAGHGEISFARRRRPTALSNQVAVLRRGRCVVRVRAVYAVELHLCDAHQPSRSMVDGAALREPLRRRRASRTSSARAYRKWSRGAPASTAFSPRAQSPRCRGGVVLLRTCRGTGAGHWWALCRSRAAVFQSNRRGVEPISTVRRWWSVGG